VNNITIEIDGVEYTFFKSMTVKRSLETLSGSFSFISSGTGSEDFPIKVGQECVISINGTRVLTGFVEQISGTLDSATDDITIVGRDKTADLIDSTLGNDISLNASFTLKELAELILKKLKITNIKIVDNVNPAPFNDRATIEIGTTAFEYLEKYAKKRQLLLTTNGNGDLVFTRSGTTILETVLSTEPGAAATIINRTFHLDTTKRFNAYVCKNQDNDSSAVFFESKTSESVDRQAIAIDKSIRATRVYTFQSGHSTMVSGELLKRAQWEANFRRAQGFSYTCLVQGFKPLSDDRIWEPNLLVRVIDKESNLNLGKGADINSTLLISSITYSLTNESGATTSLQLVTRDSFTLQVNKPEKDKKDQPESDLYFKDPEIVE
jgi:prophage tail gpP-like protein